MFDRLAALAHLLRMLVEPALNGFENVLMRTSEVACSSDSASSRVRCCSASNSDRDGPPGRRRL
jgi:hypothetical protein